MSLMSKKQIERQYDSYQAIARACSSPDSECVEIYLCTLAGKSEPSQYNMVHNPGEREAMFSSPYMAEARLAWSRSRGPVISYRSTMNQQVERQRKEHTTKCPQCGFLNQAGALICRQCDIDLAWARNNILERCPACGTRNPARSAHCSYCNFDLEHARAQPEKDGKVATRRKERTVQQAVAEGEATARLEEGVSAASSALTDALIGLLICGLVLEPYAISQARKARKKLRPGEPGYRKAQVAEVIAWIGLAVWIIVFFAQLSNI